MEGRGGFPARSRTVCSGAAIGRPIRNLPTFWMNMHLRLATLGLLLVATGCSDATEGSAVATGLELISEPDVEGTPGWPVDTVIVRAVDHAGRGVAGVSIAWTVEAGAGTVAPLAESTAPDGTLRAIWTLGIPEGPQMLSASSGALPAAWVSALATAFHARVVTAGDRQACALDPDGRAYCWGQNYCGALGLESTADLIERATPLPGDLRFRSISMSNQRHTCAVTQQGEAYCWGYGSSGQLGNPAAGDVATTPIAVATTERFASISAQGFYGGATCALAPDGRVFCWGFGTHGLLGNGAQADAPTPVLVQTAQRFTSMELGIDMGCGMTAESALWCWGRQRFDSAGFGRLPAGIHPVVPVQPDYRFVDLSLGWDHTCGLRPEGSIVCWGNNWFGSLGNLIHRTAVPLEIEGGLRFKQLSETYGKGSIALTTTGKLYRWGGTNGDNGQVTPAAMAPELTFSTMDPLASPDGAYGITVDGAVYEILSRGAIRGVPTPATP